MTVRSVSCLFVAAFTAVACRPDLPPEKVAPSAASAIALTSAIPVVELEIPDNSRGGSLPPARISIDDSWQLASSRGSNAVWQASLPIRLRSLFFQNPPPGLVVYNAEGERVRHGAGTGVRWTFDATTIRVQTNGGGPPEGWSLEYPLAGSREASLNYGFSGAIDKQTFVHATIQDGANSRTGLLLPAPSVIAWDVTVPTAGELRFDGGIVAPEVVDGPPSDGVVVVVEVETAKGIERAGRFRLDTDIRHRRIPLDRWSEQAVRLRVRTEPRASTRSDYAFLGAPSLTSNTTDPQRVILVFIDTLRPDHLGVGGYERDTSPAIDAFARDAVVFEQARSVAPWTLPTARSVTTGRHPEVYDVSTTLQSRFREQGWATAMLAGNVFLSSNFDMNRDWGLHRVTNWPPASEQVDRGLAWLDQQEGRSSLLMLHFMDAHLPYVEPESYRQLYAGAAPASLGEEFHRGQVLRADSNDPEVRQYIVDRYDGNIRFIDDQLSRLFSALNDDDIVVLFSDHGEEFWDHGGFEHGHTLYDELLRVPLIIRANGHTGRVTEPVSLLDITPTLLDLVGMNHDGLDGVSLRPALQGNVDARMALFDRDQALGRPLYGDVRWGVLHGTQKWTTIGDTERLVDVAVDPGEQRDVLASAPALAAPFAGYLGEALGTVVPQVIRLHVAPVARPANSAVTVRLTVPGGVERVWVAEDPTNKSRATVRTHGNVVTAAWASGYRDTREVYVLPTLPIAEIAGTLSATAVYGDHEDTPTNTYRASAHGEPKTNLLVGRVGNRNILVTSARVPIPLEGGAPLNATDPELLSALQEMGYAVGKDEEPASDSDSDANSDRDSDSETPLP
ncbi:MAG: arylsulfatase A-like enzyme [Myxococcota bacterium]|jgi:arylsulfatase A-like enzyme